jgi:NAD(P)-dependent dehydrogenase (short-subunit alcohol dehydrogenase family)
METTNIGIRKPLVVLVTGASSGIGNACALHFVDKGMKVYGTSRDPERYAGPRSFTMLKMDTTDQASVDAAFSALIAKEGRLDCLLNNAGSGIAGSVEDTSIGEARDQMEVNFFGNLRVTKAALPVMRAQGFGRIVSISSMAGRAGIPFQAFYAASKFAIEGLTESLRQEMRAFGVTVCVIEPGDFRTGFTASRRMVAAAGDSSPYRDGCGKALGVMIHDETVGSKPVEAARLAYRLFQKKNPRVRYTVGPAFERFAMGLKRVLPSKLYEWIFMKYYKL